MELAACWHTMTQCIFSDWEHKADTINSCIFSDWEHKATTVATEPFQLLVTQESPHIPMNQVTY